MKIKFSKTYHNSAYQPYSIEHSYNGKLSIRPFNTKKELMEYYGIHSSKVVGEDFAIANSGRKIIFKIYEGTATKNGHREIQ